MRCPRRRSRQNASQDWFSRRRGGQDARERKDNGWRSNLSEAEVPRGVKVTSGPRSGRQPPRQMRDALQGHRVNKRTQGASEDQRKTVSTLLVPFTVESQLQKLVQQAEDTFSGMLRCPRVRVVEQGGDSLIKLLGRNNPWTSKWACTDKDCMVCKSRTWIQFQAKEARKAGGSLPNELVAETSTQCRREGTNYCVQCLPCLNQGRQVLYRGESSRSSRQRGAKHERDLRTGTTMTMAFDKWTKHGQGLWPWPWMQEQHMARVTYHDPE